MNKLEQRYFDLTLKAHYEPLKDEEQSEVESIQKELNIQPCDQCKGEGGIYLPSMMGAGWDWCKCKKCKGLGELNLPPNLEKELLTINREE